MPLDSEFLLNFLQARAREHGKPPHCIVAFSGGIDSTVLLSLLAGIRAALDTQLRAVYVNHQLQPQADAWQAHCERQAARLGVEFQSVRIDVNERGNAGPEGNARAGRYAALAAMLADGDWLLTGHHEDDQAETLLLNLLRGSGVAGLRGIAPCRPLGRGLLLRPLLACSSADIAAYAHAENLEWIDDPSNDDTSFDRNFLRAGVLPLLATRWPAATRQLARSARLAGEASDLLDDLARADLARCGTAHRLSVAALSGLEQPRQANLLRYACKAQALPVPPHRQLEALQTELLPARADAVPLVQWQGAEARRYRDHLYLMPALAAEPAAPVGLLRAGHPLALAAGLGELELRADVAGGISPVVAQAGLSVRFRQGGEAIKPAGRGVGKSLKQLLQEAQVVPWLRGRVPLVYGGDALVAIGDLWVAEDFSAAAGYGIVWKNKPVLT
ncbi:MAG: tRNA lysidine(34) synthetase TilS [Woeseia sp.]